MVGPAGEQPALGGRGEVRRRLPHGPGHRQPGQRFVGLDDLDLVRGEAEAIPGVRDAHDETPARGRGEHQPDGVLPVADPQRMDLAAGVLVGDGGADLEHVRPEDLRLARAEVVRVVLHEGRAARSAFGHDLQDAQQRGGLPVALAGEPVAVRHEALDGEPRQLAQPAEVLEVRGERGEAAVIEEGP